MTKRRIKIRGDDRYERREKFNEIRNAIRVKTGSEVDEETFNKIIDILGSSVTADHMASVGTQINADTTQALEVSLGGNAEVITHLIGSQGVWTGHQDTANDPNFAIRFPGETETVLRRMSYGDTLLMQAAHITKERENDDSYWEHLWRSVYKLCGASDWQRELRYPQRAFCTAASFCSSHTKIMGLLTVTNPDFLGVAATKQSMRVPGDKYERTWNITSVNSYDDYFKAACVLVAIAHTSYLENVRDRGEGPNDIRNLFNRYLTDKGVSDIFDASVWDGDRIEPEDIPEVPEVPEEPVRESWAQYITRRLLP